MYVCMYVCMCVCNMVSKLMNIYVYREFNQFSFLRRMYGMVCIYLASGREALVIEMIDSTYSTTYS